MHTYVPFHTNWLINLMKRFENCKRTINLLYCADDSPLMEKWEKIYFTSSNKYTYSTSRRNFKFYCYITTIIMYQYTKNAEKLQSLKKWSSKKQEPDLSKHAVS